MSDGVGLSIGATNLTAVVVGRTALTRSPVLTLYPHRPPEVGVPSENPHLTERGLIITDFVDRVGDPVGIVASDGSTHHADALLADALRAMLLAVGRGRAPAEPVAVTYPAHWRPRSVEALRNALAALPEFHGAALVPDSTAALTALQDDPGLPTRGVIAVCDFGGTGSSVTSADVAEGFPPIGPTVRHTDLSGDFIDQALLTHVIDDLSAAGTIDLTVTSAIGPLTRLRGQCRGAKERLSTSTVTSLVAELPGHRTDVRLTRNELDDATRAPFADFVGVVQETLDGSGIRPADLVAVASVGGGARMPIITTTLSERFRVPVITSAQPELVAAIGAGLIAVRGTVEEGRTSMAAAPAAAAAAAAATQMSPEADAGGLGSSTFRALAWSDADDIPEVTPSDPYDYPADGGHAADAGGGFTDARPPMQFDHDGYERQETTPLPWHRRPAVLVGAAAVAVLAAVLFAVLFVMRDDSVPAPALTTPPVTTTPTPAEAPPPPPPAPATQAPPPATQAPPPETRTVTRQAPPPVTQTQAPPPPPPPTEAPPPPPTSEAPPPPSPEPTSEPTAEPSPRPPWRPTPPYPTIPGLPWVPAPQLPQPAQ